MFGEGILQLERDFCWYLLIFVLLMDNMPGSLVDAGAILFQ